MALLKKASSNTAHKSCLLKHIFTCFMHIQSFNYIFFFPIHTITVNKYGYECKKYGAKYARARGDKNILFILTFTFLIFC